MPVVNAASAYYSPTRLALVCEEDIVLRKSRRRFHTSSSRTVHAGLTSISSKAHCSLSSISRRWYFLQTCLPRTKTSCSTFVSFVLVVWVVMVVLSRMVIGFLMADWALLAEWLLIWILWQFLTSCSSGFLVNVSLLIETLAPDNRLLVVLVFVPRCFLFFFFQDFVSSTRALLLSPTTSDRQTHRNSMAGAHHILSI